MPLSDATGPLVGAFLLPRSEDRRACNRASAYTGGKELPLWYNTYTVSKNLGERYAISSRTRLRTSRYPVQPEYQGDGKRPKLPPLRRLRPNRNKKPSRRQRPVT